MELSQTISPYIAVSSTDFEKRFVKLLKARNKEESNKFVAALKELEQTKANLVTKFSDNPLIGYKVPSGLGAVCVTCVEQHVTDILTRHGFQTQIHARQLPDRIWENGRKRPIIHAYNIVEVCGTDFVVDLDADPFVGRNVGIIVAPLQTNIPWYSDGFLYHSRSVTRTGTIANYKFSFQNNEGQIRTYLEGDMAEYITIAPYHGRSEESLCPLCLAGGATIYFSFEKYYIGNSGPYYRIPFILVCPIYPGEKNCTYQLTINDVDHIRVHRQQSASKEHSRPNLVVISIRLKNGCKLQFLLTNDGTLVANDFVSFASAELASPSGFKVRLSAKDGPKPKIILPKPSHA